MITPLAAWGLILLLIASMTVDVCMEYADLAGRWSRLPVWLRTALVVCIFALTGIAGVNHAEPYIYFQF